MSTTKNKNDIAISVQNVSKKFVIPHEKIDSLRGAFVNAFKTKTYEEFEALKDISFEVKKGEFFGIIGRNGSGKSTLLKILAGIYEADQGKIKINGRISPFLELGIGFNPELSGRDNVYLNATVLGMSKKEIDKKFDSIVNFSELERFIDQKLKNYSSGMQVRLAFSVAIHANREILLMDEVLAVGDVNFKKKCLETFRNFKKAGKTIILVSHDTETVKEFCDRAMLINKGMKIFSGTPDNTLYEYSKIVMENKQLIKPKLKSEPKNNEAISVKNKSKKIANYPKETIKKKTNYYKKITTCNVKGDSTKVFRSEEEIIINIELNIEKPENNIFLSLGIYDEISDRLVSGNNMFFEKEKVLWKKGINIIKLKLQGNIFNRGQFYLSSTLFQGDPKDNFTFDYFNGKEKNQFIEIIPRNLHNGIIYQPHEWIY